MHREVTGGGSLLKQLRCRQPALSEHMEILTGIGLVEARRIGRWVVYTRDEERSPTERPSDCIVSLAANSKGVGLSFYRGATLADPAGILLGSGSQNRFIRLKSAATLSEPAVKKLIAAAIAQSTTAPAKSGGRLVIRSVSAKQRPRR